MCVLKMTRSLTEPSETCSIQGLELLSNILSYSQYEELKKKLEIKAEPFPSPLVWVTLVAARVLTTLMHFRLSIVSQCQDCTGEITTWTLATTPPMLRRNYIKKSLTDVDITNDNASSLDTDNNKAKPPIMIRRNYTKESLTDVDILNNNVKKPIEVRKPPSPLADTKSSSPASPPGSVLRSRMPISGVDMLDTMKAEAKLRKWRVNPKTLAINRPMIRRNYIKKSLTDGALQFKIPISGVKMLKKKKRRLSQKKKAPTPSPPQAQPVITEVRYMTPEVEKEKVVKKKENKPQAKKGEDVKKKENRPKANKEFKISVSDVCHFFNMSDYPIPVTDEMRESFQDYSRFETFCVPLLATVNPFSDPLKLKTLCHAKWREVLASYPAKPSPCEPDCQHSTRPRNNMIWVNTY